MFQVNPQHYSVQQPIHHSSSLPTDTMSSLPPNTVMVRNAAGEQKPRKLRASCDACSRAKVKCDKVRPTCHRCGNMGICCHYSPSMRLGKPRKHRNPDGSIMRDVTPGSSSGPVRPRTAMIPRTTSYTVESSPEPSDPFFYAPPTPEYHYQDAFMRNAFDRGHSPYSDAGSYASGWSNEDPMMYQSPTETFTSMPSFPPASSPYGHSRNTSVQSQPEVFLPMDTTSSPPIPSTQFFPVPEQSNPAMFHQEKYAPLPPMAQSPLPTPPTSASFQSHDCIQLAFQTLNSLYSPPVSNVTSSEVNSTSGRLPTLDTILSINKSSVDKLFVLLGCPCSANSHFSTTISLTITKVLSWYQEVARSNQRPSGSPTNGSMESLTHHPKSLGSFRLEGENDDTVRTQHILGELRRIEKLIDKFQDRYCKSVNPVETGIDIAVFGALESDLRTRVRNTFKVTMKVAPEEVKRQVASRSQQQRARTITI